MTRARSHIAAMSPYALAAIEPPVGKPLISLSQNESLRSPSPRALEAAARTLWDGALYPDPDWTALRASLAEIHDIDVSGILCGTGSLDLIGSIARVYAGPDRAVLAPTHAYPFFRTATQMANARFDTADETDAVVNVDALLAAVKTDTGLVFVANPGNPTGTRISRSELLRLRSGLRQDILLVIDEAYGEFSDHFGERCFDMVAEENVVVLRTFSKAYGMAGFRVGWGLFPTVIAAELRKVLNPNNVAAASQAAAVAALSDQSYMRVTCDLTVALREKATDDLRAAGFQVLPSYTNFVLLDLGSEEQASSIDAALRAKGVFLRRQGGAGLPHMLRMTIGPRDAMDTAVSLMTKLKKEQTL
mgnify:CR=1 FL=1